MKKYKYFYIAAALLSLTSCGDYLDKMPDNRTEVNSVEKVKAFWLPLIRINLRFW